MSAAGERVRDAAEAKAVQSPQVNVGLALSYRKEGTIQAGHWCVGGSSALYVRGQKPYAAAMATSAPHRRVIMDADDVRRVTARLAHDIDDRVRAAAHGPLGLNPALLTLVGIRTGGAHLAHRLARALGPIAGRVPDVGILDITLYRDDVLAGGAMPVLQGTEIDFDIEGRPIILVDDVLFTGRTVRAALEALLDLGRPAAVMLAVLVDRGLRELPIAPDFVGRSVETSRAERVDVAFVESGADADDVSISLAADRRLR